MERKGFIRGSPRITMNMLQEFEKESACEKQPSLPGPAQTTSRDPTQTSLCYASILFSLLLPLQPTLHPAVRSIRSQDCSAHHPPMAPPSHSKLTPSSLWDLIPQTTFHSATVLGASFPSVEHTRHVPMSGSVIIPSARSTPTTLVRSLIFFRSLLSCHLYNEASPV